MDSRVGLVPCLAVLETIRGFSSASSAAHLDGKPENHKPVTQLTSNDVIRTLSPSRMASGSLSHNGPSPRGPSTEK